MSLSQSTFNLLFLLVVVLVITNYNQLHAQVTKPVSYSLTTLLGGPIGDGIKATAVGINKPVCLAVDKRNGNMYYTDMGNHQVRYFDKNGISHMFAGSPTFQSGIGSDDLAFANDTFYDPYGIAVNSKGDVYITDTSSFRVKKIYYNSTINVHNMITIAGGGSLLTSGIPALSARLSYPRGIAVSPNDEEVYFCDTSNYLIRKIVNNTIYTVLGTGTAGWSPDGTLATSASISTTYSIAFHPITGLMFFAEFINSQIRYIANNGTIQTYVSVSYPNGITFDSNGDLYVISSSQQILKIVNGVQTVIANNPRNVGFSGDGGNAYNAALNAPTCVTIYNNSLYITDSQNYRIRKIDLPSNNITTVAGDGNLRYVALSGSRSDISLVTPLSTYYNSNSDELLIVDNTQSAVLRLNSVTNYTTSLVEIVAGTGVSAYDIDGKVGNKTSIYSPYSVIQSESTGDIYIGTSNLIMKVNKENQTLSTIAGTQNMYAGDGKPAIYAQLYTPTSITTSPSGEIYFSDAGSNVIRKIDKNGIISTVAGDGQGSGFLDGPALSSKFYYPNGLVFNANGDLLIVDYFNNRIRKLSASYGNVTTIAGAGYFGFNGEGILATSAYLSTPACICINSTSGDIIFSDINNHRIRRIDSRTNLIYTIVGMDTYVPFTPDGLNGTSTTVTPYGLAIHPISGELYFVDSAVSPNVIRRIDSKDGKVYTVIGGGKSYSKSSFANSTFISSLSYIAFSPNGDLYLSCPSNRVIKKMDYGSDIVYDVAGTNPSTTGDGPALSTYLDNPTGLVSVMNGELIFAEGGSANKIRKLSGGMITTLAGGIVDGGEAKNAYIRTISSLALTDTDLYLSDKQNLRIRKISLSSGILSSVVGTYGYLDNGNNLANQTNINQVNEIRIRNNEIIFTDTNNFKIRKTSISGNEKVTTIAGKGYSISVTTENVLATQSYLNLPGSIGYLPNGELIIADTKNGIIRKVDLNGYITFIAGKYFQSGFNGDYSNAKNALLNNPQGLSILPDGRIIFADTNNIRIRMLTPYCETGYSMAQSSSGTVCQTISCYGIAFNDSTVCSGRGSCQSLNNCSCLAGYSGMDCSTSDFCSLYPTSYVCSSSSFQTAETQVTKVSNITQLDSKTIQFSSTSAISISLPSVISQYLQNIDTSLKNDSVQVVSSLSQSNTESAVISQVVSLVLLKASSSEKISVQNLQKPISFSFNSVNLTLPNIETLNISCVYFDENSKDWKSDGMTTDIQNLVIHNLADGNITLTLTVTCQTTHLTSFSVIDQNYKKATQTKTDDSVILKDYTVLIAAVVGGVGGLCVIIVIVTLIIVAICLLRRRRRK